jgi:tetratricopeptide (TPR) repeat protein
VDPYVGGVLNVVLLQLGLYYVALGSERRAIESFSKALFISPDDVSAIVHLCRLYLAAAERPSTLHPADNVDLAAGMLSELTRGPGWDVAEAWYFLAKAYGMQGRKDRERECLGYALALSENRPVRDIGTAIGWCL